MKNTLITLLFSLLVLTGFSQDLSYEISGTNSNTITKEKLIAAKTMRDINPGYPSSSWITEYISTQVMATCNGKVMKAVNANDILSEEQKNILKTADLGADIVLDVYYKQINAVTANLEMHQMNFSFAVVPETKAEYPGGYEQVKKYLKEHAISKLTARDNKKLQATVRFTVNEQGEIANAQIAKTSGDKKTDRLLVDAINNMPKWKPAENSKGIKVKQNFVFTVGSGDGC